MRMFQNLFMSLGISAMLLTGSALAADAPEGEPFGELPDGTKVQVFTLKNANGMEMRVMDYGATVLSLTAPDRDGNFEDVVLGCDTLEDYLEGVPYFGCVVGRYGNRIAHGKFSLDGKEYTLPLNDKPGDIPCSLHGGLKGFDKVVWNVAMFSNNDRGAVLVLNYVSKDGEEGYPGTLDITVLYAMANDNSWVIHYLAKTDAPTVLNPTQHTYFNLNGAKRDILDHVVMIDADAYTPTDAGLIPTGEIASVEGTPMDFREPTTIGARIDDDFESLKLGGGYDHNWVLNAPVTEAIGSLGNIQLRHAVRVVEPESGRVLEVLTSQPGVQFYTGNFLDGTNVGKGGVKYEHRYGFCFETQHYPDSPNQPSFPSTELKPGEIYQQTTIYRFSTE